MRRLLTITLSLFLTVGVAAGQQNDAQVTQDGADNDVDVTQQAEGTHGPNTFTVTQDGEGNKVREFEQAGSGNDASIRQVGDRNTVASNPQQGFLGDATPKSHHGKIDIDQFGTANDVYDVDQRGYGNTAIIQQRALLSGVANNLVDIDAQIGPDSEAGAPEGPATTPMPGAAEAPTPGGGNTAVILQTTNGNAVGTGTGSIRGILQKGKSNLLAVFQVNGPRNEVGTKLSGAYNGSNTVAQDGERNSAVVSQRGLGGQSVEYLIQEGTANRLTVDQFGGRQNSAATIQMNGHNHSAISQNGSRNTSRVTQK